MSISRIALSTVSALVLAGCGVTADVAAQEASHSLTPSPAPIVATERAFAADELIMGLDRSFLKYSTEDAILLSSAPVRTRDVLDPNAVLDPAAPSLVWYPLWAGIASSGDLGFTTGPTEIGGRRGGYYFTVWKKQPDGSWKWVYDGGAAVNAESAPPSSTEPTYLAASTGRSISPEAAMEDVRAAEGLLSARAGQDYRAALQEALTPDGRVYVPGFAPAAEPHQVATVLASAPATMTFEPPLGGGSSEAGDLAWVYGAASWTRDTTARRGHYVRIWQKRGDAWRLVFYQILPS